MIERRKFGELGGADHGWLKAKHHFSFARYYDPSRMGWGNLRVWNDDEIAAGAGFPPHPHADMEIITYVRQGIVTHEDSAGNIGRTVAGDVQVISAGTGSVIPSAIVARFPSSCSRFGCFLVNAAERRAGTIAASRRPIAPDD